MVYRWRADILKALPAHGVRPRASTNPELVRAYVSELYSIELRMLRARLLRGEFPKRDYAGLVDAKRRQYGVLALKARDWVTAP